MEQKVPYAALSFVPIRKNKVTGKYEKLVAFDVELNESDNLQNGKKGSSGRTYAQHSVLANGNWYKISVANSGIYKITYNDLVSLGINVGSIDPRNIRIYGNGAGMLPEKNTGFKYDDLQENAIVVAGESDGRFDPSDYILFYGECPVTWTYSSDKAFHHTTNSYSNATYYFITTDLGAGKRIGSLPSSNLPNNKSVSKFIDYAYHENNSVNLIQSGREWYGETFDIQTSYDFNVSFPNLDASSLLYLKADVVARSGNYSNFFVTANGTRMTISVPNDPDVGNADGQYAEESSGAINFSTTNPSVSINVTYNKLDQSSLGWLNYFELNAIRNLSFYGTQMSFRSVESIGAGNITEFTLSDANSFVNIWDVTDPLNAKQVGTTLNNTDIVFRLPTDSLHEFIAFNGSSFFSPSLVGKVGNQDLHGILQSDFIIVSYPDFVSEANRLAQFHRDNDNYSVLVVTPEQIYNEFSSGAQDVSAIRDFVKMLYDRAPANQIPKYLLFFGDGSYNYKSTTNNTNYVPTYESLNSLNAAGSYLTDDYFGLLDDGEGSGSSGTVDIGIGRFPVRTVAQAKDVVDKVFRYASKTDLVQAGYSGNSFSSSFSNFGDWRNIICFVADDKDGDLHLGQAEQLANYVDTSQKQFNIEKIYLDAYKEITTSGGQRYPDANAAINNRVEKGALIVNYTGHSGMLGWAQERVLNISDVNNWNNTNNLPVFITASCEFSRFDNPASVSAGELILLNPAGGGIALFSTTRLAYSSTNLPLNKSFFDYVFQKQNNEYYRMGDIIRKAKVANLGSGDNIKNFVLLGDPALQLAYPQYKVVTTLINNDSVNKKSDTLEAFSKATVSGYIQDYNGNIKTDFNGTLYPTVYDKYSQVSTLGNDPESPVKSFSIQNNILYKGKAVISNGEFTFTFIVPKDIAYNYGFGKISYYAASDNTDANGFYKNITVGGSLNNVSLDEDGPVIHLYMNDTLFKSGGITDQSPFMLAYINDKVGVNTVGNGIGHDIVAVLDGNTSDCIVLNNYYEADLNSYTSGTIKYPFTGLSDGAHTLSLKVWDSYDNSSTAEIEFIVINSNQLKLSKVLNYPNPFTSETKFSFEHNCSCSQLDVEIRIYNLTGQTVKTIKEAVNNEGYDASVQWDGTGDNGVKLSGGIYLYRLKISDSGGASANKGGKLIIF